MIKKITKALTLVTCFGFVASANASLITTSGSVTTTDVGIHNFSIGQTSDIDIWELSTQDFRLGIFDDLGVYITGNDDNGYHTGQNFLDASVLINSLSVGNYSAVVSSWTNFSLTIDGYGNNDRQGSYTINFEGDYVSLEQPAVPEPATLALFGIGLAGMGFARKKKKSA